MVWTKRWSPSGSFIGSAVYILCFERMRQVCLFRFGHIWPESEEATAAGQYLQQWGTTYRKHKTIIFELITAANQADNRMTPTWLNQWKSSVGNIQQLCHITGEHLKFQWQTKPQESTKYNVIMNVLKYRMIFVQHFVLWRFENLFTFRSLEESSQYADKGYFVPLLPTSQFVIWSHWWHFERATGHTGEQMVSCVCRDLYWVNTWEWIHAGVHMRASLLSAPDPCCVSGSLVARPVCSGVTSYQSHWHILCGMT